MSEAQSYGYISLSDIQALCKRQEIYLIAYMYLKIIRNLNKRYL